MKDGWEMFSETEVEKTPVIRHPVFVGTPRVEVQIAGD